jgi:hypothetical protein
MLLLFAKFLEQGLNVLEDEWSKLRIVYGAQAGLGGQSLPCSAGTCWLGDPAYVAQVSSPARLRAQFQSTDAGSPHTHTPLGDASDWRRVCWMLCMGW